MYNPLASVLETQNPSINLISITKNEYEMLQFENHLLKAKKLFILQILGIFDGVHN